MLLYADRQTDKMTTISVTYLYNYVNNNYIKEKKYVKFDPRLILKFKKYLLAHKLTLLNHEHIS